MPKKPIIIEPINGTFDQVIDSLLMKNDKNIIEKKKKKIKKKGK